MASPINTSKDGSRPVRSVALGVALANPDHALTGDRRRAPHPDVGRRCSRDAGLGRLSPIVADAHGHGIGAYRAAGRAALVQRELDWLETR